MLVLEPVGWNIDITWSRSVHGSINRFFLSIDYTLGHINNLYYGLCCMGCVARATLIGYNIFVAAKDQVYK